MVSVYLSHLKLFLRFFQISVFFPFGFTCGLGFLPAEVSNYLVIQKINN